MKKQKPWLAALHRMTASYYHDGPDVRPVLIPAGRHWVLDRYWIHAAAGGRWSGGRYVAMISPPSEIVVPDADVRRLLAKGRLVLREDGAAVPTSDGFDYCRRLSYGRHAIVSNKMGGKCRSGHVMTCARWRKMGLNYQGGPSPAYAGAILPRTVRRQAPGKPSRPHVLKRIAEGKAAIAANRESKPEEKPCPIRTQLRRRSPRPAATPGRRGS